MRSPADSFSTARGNRSPSAADRARQQPVTAISGAAGITNADVACRRSLACQEYPGSRTSLVAKADAALGAALPSNQHESDYVATSDSGLLLALDARLDNRSELVRSLNLSRNDLGDARLFAAAWERWGEDALDHIIGDFAQQGTFCHRELANLTHRQRNQPPLAEILNPQLVDALRLIQAWQGGLDFMLPLFKLCFHSADTVVSWVLAMAAIRPNASGSRTARSASVLRSNST